MNICLSAWIPATREDGSRCKIAPWQIAETSNPVMEISAPRPDFQGALYQLLIGLLQTCFAPADIEEWLDYSESPPDANQLKQQLTRISAAFELQTGIGHPAFMQDLTLTEGDEKNIASLLIDAPGGKTQNDNLDFFVKGGQVNQACPGCTAQALFTLQTNAPAGGAGNRVGLRGGGPLTTLVYPASEKNTLWQKLWLNVLDQETFTSNPFPLDGSLLPWLTETRVSDKNGKTTFPEDVHPLQMYWGMPRRIRLSPTTEKGNCDLCGEYSDTCYSHYTSKNCGTNYDGPWVHPLTPYRFDPKNTEPPLSLKGQKGGISYRNWLGLMLVDNDNGNHSAKVVQDFFASKSRYLDSGRRLRLWCFGYDMDNMKARCWYEHQLPVFHLQAQQIKNMQSWIQQLLTAAKETTALLRKYVKEAWYRRPSDVSGDFSFIDSEFWQHTESNFYLLLADLASLPPDTAFAPNQIYEHWYNTLWKTIDQLFNQFALQTSVEDLDLKRVMQARSNLFKKFNSTTSIKNLKAKMQPTREVTNHE